MLPVYKWEMGAAVAQWIALSANGQEGHPTTVPFLLLGTVLGSVPPLSCAGFVCGHCTGRWAVLDNTHGKHRWVLC